MLSKVKRKIQDGWNVNQTVDGALLKPRLVKPLDDEHNKWPVILVACFCSTAPVVDLLLKSGADVSACLSNGLNCVACVLCNELVSGREREDLLRVSTVTRPCARMAPADTAKSAPGAKMHCFQCSAARELGAVAQPVRRDRHPTASPSHECWPSPTAGRPCAAQLLSCRNLRQL